MSKKSLFVRNIIFGVEDSLVSTVGLLAGMATQTLPTQVILLTGFIYIFVEGFSMAVGSFLSEEATREFEQRGSDGVARALFGGTVMFVSFVISGFVPVLPYLLFSGSTALTVSIVLSLLVLGLLAYVHARASKLPAFGRILRMVLLGGAAILIGVLVSHFFSI